MRTPKMLIILSVVMASLCQNIFAQICEGNITLSSQTDVDSFQCEKIFGNLTISGDDICNLSNLAALKLVTGDLIIANNPALKTLDGLSSVDSIGKSLRIIGNSQLLNVRGLKSLKVVSELLQISTNLSIMDVDIPEIRHAGGLAIRSNQSLQKVCGFSQLSIVGPLDITYNPNLLSIEGFHSLKATIRNFIRIPAGFSIADNPSLQTITAFASLIEVGNLTISNNNSLMSLDGLNSLRWVYGVLSITNNSMLATVDGFNQLQGISNISKGVTHAALIIDRNASLESLNGLSSMKSVGIEYNGSVSITNNARLRNIDGLSSLAIIAGQWETASLEISNNAVLENIDALSSLTTMTALQHVTIKVTHNPRLESCCSIRSLIKSVSPIYISHTTIDISENGGCTLEEVIACGPQEVVKFQLVDTRTGNLVDQFHQDSITLDVADDNYQYWAIQASTFPDSVGSVAFRSGYHVRHVENVPPYWLPVSHFQKLGTYYLSAYVYTERNATGSKGVGRSAVVTIKNSAAILNFDVVDTHGNFLTSLNENSHIDINDNSFKTMTVVAAASYGSTSVKFWLNDRFVRIERVAPFTLHGDLNGIFNSWSAKPGSYVLKAIPYVTKGTNEFPGVGKEIRFFIDNSNRVSVTSFEVVDGSGNFLRLLNEGDVIDANDFKGNNATIIARTIGSVKAVRFDMNQSFYSLENFAPYTLTGDREARYFNPWLPKPAHYKITATAYPMSNSVNTQHASLTINFDVVEDRSLIVQKASHSGGEQTGGNDPDLFLFPVPAERELYVETSFDASSKAMLSVLTVQGKIVWNAPFSRATQIDTSCLEPGVYVIRISEHNGAQKVARFIKK